MPSYIPPLSSVLRPEWLHDETIGVLLRAVGAIDAFPSSKAFVGALCADDETVGEPLLLTSLFSC